MISELRRSVHFYLSVGEADGWASVLELCRSKILFCACYSICVVTPDQTLIRRLQALDRMSLDCHRYPIGSYTAEIRTTTGNVRLGY